MGGSGGSRLRPPGARFAEQILPRVTPSSTGQLRVPEDRLVLLGGRGFLAPLASCTKPIACCGATGTLGTPASDGDTGTLGTLAAWHSPAHGAWAFGVMQEGILWVPCA